MDAKKFVKKMEEEKSKEDQPDPNRKVKFDSKKIIKTEIVKKGTGEYHPQLGDLCDVHYKCTLPSGKTMDDTWAKGKGVRFVIGKGHAVPGIEAAVSTMLLGEYSKFLIHPKWLESDKTPYGQLPKEAPLDFEVQLVYIKKKKDVEKDSKVSGLTVEEKLKKCVEIKQKGNEQYKQQCYENAYKLYRRATVLLEERIDPNTGQKLKDELKALLLSCYLNISAVSLKMGDNDGTINVCTLALNMKSANIKALFRRGQAYVKIEEYDKGIRDFERLLEFAPDNLKNTVNANLKKAKQLRAKFEKKLKSGMAKMFE